MEANERSRLHHNSNLQEEGSCTITTPLEKRLLIILIIVVAIGIGLCVALAANTKGDPKGSLNLSNNTCFTPECIATASRLLHSMDLKQKPCDDFYSFVCNNWIKNNFLVGEISTQFTRLNSIILLRIKELLETPHLQLTENENKTQRFYNACMDIGARDEIGSLILLKDFKKFGGWPLLDADLDGSKLNWSDLIIHFYESGYPIDMLLSVNVDLDIKNTSTSLILVNQPSLGLSNEDYYILTKSKVIKRYKELILKMAMYLKSELNQTKALEDIEDAFAIEKKLAEVSVGRLNSRRPEEYYNIMTLKEVEKFSSKIPWRYILGKLLPPNTPLTDSQRFMIANPKALETLNDILENDSAKGKRSLANYMFYRAALFAAEHLDQDTFYLYEDKLHRSSHQDLWQMCVKTVMDFFHMSLTATYAERYMDDEAKANLEMMFQGLQVSLLDAIKGAKWLDQETKERALLKVKKTRSTIAYRDEILNEEKLNEYYSPIEINEDHFSNVKAIVLFKTKEKMQGLGIRRPRFKWSDMNSVLTANAFYLPNSNGIILPIGLLQDTFYSSGRPNYINYGSLGVILGHEFTHAFDSIGSLYDEDGNYRMWWTNESWVNFQEKAKCFVDQYDQYYEPAVDSSVNGTITLSENIADNGGLLAAFNAYQKLLEKIKKENQLPGLPFTERQMFWISYASVWCRRLSNHMMEYTIENSVHAPAKFRINGALSNMKEFSEDFKCTIGSTLNPRTKCSLW